MVSNCHSFSLVAGHWAYSPIRTLSASLHCSHELVVSPFAPTPRGTPTRTPEDTREKTAKQGYSDSSTPQETSKTLQNTGTPCLQNKNRQRTPQRQGPRAATMATPSPLSRDDADMATAQESDIRCEKDAQEWMVTGVYLVQGESVTPKRLAHAMLQMAASIPKLTKMGTNALRAAACVMHCQQKNRYNGVSFINNGYLSQYLTDFFE